MNTLYTTNDVAKLFGLNNSRLHYWAQTGFINPRGTSNGKKVYTFIDLIEIKAAKELLDAGIPLQRVRRNLKALRSKMPNATSPMKMLRICSNGDELTIADGESLVEPVSGQLLLDFDVGELGHHVAQVLQFEFPKTTSRKETSKVQKSAETILPVEATTGEVEYEGDPINAYQWFKKGCAFDDNENLKEAAKAYEKAVQLDPGLAAAHTNLGNIRYQQGNRRIALNCYQTAITLDPDQPEALYNLANIYEEEGDLDMAVSEYKRALNLQPDFADAHFNLALTLEDLGGKQQALHHWKRYLDLTTDDDAFVEWRELAEQHLSALAG